MKDVGESRKFEIQVDIPNKVQLNNFPCYTFSLSFQHPGFNEQIK